MFRGIEINRRENVLLNIKTLKEIDITIEKLNNADIVSEFEKLLLKHSTELNILPLIWFRTEIKKRMDENGQRKRFDTEKKKLEKQSI